MALEIMCVGGVEGLGNKRIFKAYWVVIVVVIEWPKGKSSFRGGKNKYKKRIINTIEKINNKGKSYNWLK